MSAVPSPQDQSARFVVHRTPAPRIDDRVSATEAAPKFGTVFSDHMARISWHVDQGWHAYRVEPYGPIQLDPAAAVLHYAQEVFEGLKCYRHADGSIWAFRPDANARRLAASAARLALPQLSVADFLGSISALVQIDRDWVPSAPESSLYLRPFMFASESFVGVRPSHAVEYFVIASPAGAYFASGVAPVSIWVEREYSRAGSGGTGAAKCGGNYASSLLPQVLAQQHGCDQVCFLDSSTHTYLEELGGMNVFVVMHDGSVHTPSLSGSILEGITRESIVQLCRDESRSVTERKITVAEIQSGLVDGSITEIFACGTAAVVTPIGRLASDAFDLTVADGTPGPVTMAIRERLTAIQTGHATDPHGWMMQIA